MLNHNVMNEINNLYKHPVIGKEVSEFDLEAFYNENTKRIKLSEYRGKWVVLFFYPADFTFVCPTELEDLADNYEEFKKLDAEILSVSTDTVFVHKAWHDHSAAIKKIQFPMLADPTGNLCKEMGVYIYEEGLALRGTFIIDPEGKLIGYEVNNNDIGRNADELLRKLKAAQFVRTHKGQVCPAKWQPGKKTLTPGLDLVGKI